MKKNAPRLDGGHDSLLVPNPVQQAPVVLRLGFFARSRKHGYPQDIPDQKMGKHREKWRKSIGTYGKSPKYRIEWENQVWISLNIYKWWIFQWAMLDYRRPCFTSWLAKEVPSSFWAQHGTIRGIPLGPGWNKSKHAELQQMLMVVVVASIQRIGLRENLQETIRNHRFSHDIWGFPVVFPSENQSIQV